MEPTTSTPLFLRPRLLAAVIGLLVVANGGGLIDTSYYAIGPGPATDILSEVRLPEAQTYPSKGKLLITTVGVSNGPLNIWEWIETAISPSIDRIHRERLIPAGVTDEQQDFRNRVDMERSKISAQAAAFVAAGYRVSELPGGRVLGVDPRGPSVGRLQVHDRILAVNGRRVAQHEDIPAMVRRLEPGDTARISIERDGKPMDVEVVTDKAGDDPKAAALGVVIYPAYDLPFEVSIDTHRISGPSGGLVFALSIVDLLTPEDLTGGKTIAVTGTLTFTPEGDGVVGPIGGIAEKVKAAKAVGAAAFILPAGNADEAMAAGPGKMQIIPVERLSDALQALRRLNVNRRV